MAAKKHEWIFPSKEFFFMKIETLTIAVLAVLIFFASFSETESWVMGIVFTLVFLVLYSTISFFIQKARLVREKYQITDTHLHINRKTRRKEEKHKISLKDVTHHKLDKFFLGGYLIAKGKKHVLFFNTLDELKKFEKMLKKGMKKK
jgi:hypothetical protein